MAQAIQFPLSPSKGNEEDPSARIIDRGGATIGTIEVRGHTAAENYQFANMLVGAANVSFGLSGVLAAYNQFRMT